MSSECTSSGYRWKACLLGMQDDTNSKKSPKYAPSANKRKKDYL